MQSRKSLIVYFKSPKVLKKLKTMGNLTYYHKKRKYAVLYVDGDKVDTLIADMKKLHHVKYAELSRLDDSPYMPEDLENLGEAPQESESSEETEVDSQEVSSEKA